MKNIILTLGFLGIVSGAIAQPWTLDKMHTSVRFNVAHMVISEVEGTFSDFDINVTSSKPDFTDASIDFTAKINSINTGMEMRDNHLKGDDFFNAEKFPTLQFKSTSFKKVSDKKYVLEGNLTIRDITKKVKLDVTYGGTIKDPYGNKKAGFKVTGSINRFDYNLKWSNKLETGQLVVGDEVNLDIKLELQSK